MQTQLSKSIGSEKIETVLESFKLFQDGIDTAMNKTHGLKEWFKAYVASDAYSQMEEYAKNDAFEGFMQLFEFLQRIAPIALLPDFDKK